MKGSFRQSMRWLHTWTGLVLGGLLYFIFITGSAGYFDTEIDRWMQPELPLQSATIDQAGVLAVAEQRFNQIAADAQTWSITFPIGREPLLIIWWKYPVNKQAGEGGSWQNEKLDLQTALPVTARSTGGGQLLYQMHWLLHYLPRTLAIWIVGFSSMFMLLALITGIIIHKKIFKDFFTFRPGKKALAWLDMHNVLSVLPLPFHLMITFSGLIFIMFTTMPGIISASYGVGEDNHNRFSAAIFSTVEHNKEAAGVKAETIPIATVLLQAQQRWGQGQVRRLDVENIGDAHARIKVMQLSTDLGYGETLVYDGVSGELLSIVGENTSGALQFYQVIIALHEGLFADIILRWLYFLSGLMGAAMIATGMILWVVKRRNKAQKSGQNSKGLILVERLNVGVIVGLPIAIAVYFWANRLIPVQMEGRADWEVNALFISWGVALLYPVLRRCIQCTWIELLWLAALLYGGLPLLNVLTTQRHLSISLIQQDWVMAGFDLTMLAFGIVFGLTAIKIQSKNTDKNTDATTR